MKQSIPVIAVFDIGKTNKKLLLFDEQYRLVFERSAPLAEIVDEDGFACEDLKRLRLFVFDSLKELFRMKEYKVKAINFSSYGASLIYLDKSGKPLTPLYNYLKPFPDALKLQFYEKYGGEEAIALNTASPVLGSLNSGLQLYRLKYEKPEVFKKIYFVLHLPQYLSFLISGRIYADMTSIGCHTQLWDFSKNDYHEWVAREGLLEKMPPVVPYCHTVPSTFPVAGMVTGVGLHDSSAALIPYLENFHESFVLISTGTWCISMNPFNLQPLSLQELKRDCLYYITYKGKPVKASRLFAGFEYEEQIKRIASHFQVESACLHQIPFDQKMIDRLQQPSASGANHADSSLDLALFSRRDLSLFSSPEEAYYQLMLDLVREQVNSTKLVLKDCPVKRIFLDGGFSKNQVFMNILASALPELEVFAASMPQATGAGTALAIHHAWNSKPMPTDSIKLKYYPPTQKETL